MLRPIHLLAVSAVLLLAGCASVPPAEPPAPAGAVTKPQAAAPAAPVAKEITTFSGLRYVDVNVGDGELAEDGMTVAVHYTGWLLDGTKFDSSRDRGSRPFTFQIGAGQVIRGWDEGVRGMRVGGKRKLTIPPDLAYGDREVGGVIPANATLVFDVELMAIVSSN